MQFYTNSLIELPMLFNSISVIHVIKWNSINRFYHEFFYLKLNIIEIAFFSSKVCYIYLQQKEQEEMARQKEEIYQRQRKAAAEKKKQVFRKMSTPMVIDTREAEEGHVNM